MHTDQANGRGQFPVTKQEMATTYADREVLALATGDDDFSQIVRIERIWMKLSEPIIRALMGEAIPGPGRNHSRTRV